MLARSGGQGGGRPLAGREVSPPRLFLSGVAWGALHSPAFWKKGIDKLMESWSNKLCQTEPPICAGEPVIVAKRVHPFPSRTRKLSSSAPTILRGRPRGKIGNRRFTRSHGRFCYASLPE